MKSLLARIDSAAETAGLSRSEWIRRCCAEATTALIDAAGHDLDDRRTQRDHVLAKAQHHLRRCLPADPASDAVVVGKKGRGHVEPALRD